MSTLIQMPDQPGNNSSYTHNYGWGTVALAAGQFVIVECAESGRQYLGQIVSPQLNLNQDGLEALGNQTANFLQAIHGERIKREVAVKEIFWYVVQLLQDVTTGKAQSVRMRPQIGAKSRAATEAEITRYIGLPPVDEACRLGSIMDTNVAVCVNDRILFHHILNAGSVGSGKTNDLASIIHAAQHLGMHVIVYDHKPDYQYMHLANEEQPLETWYKGLQNVHYWCLGNARHANEREIVVPASELDPAVLAATIYYQPNEYNAADVAEMLLSQFAEERQGASWSIANFYEWLPRNHQDLRARIDIDVHPQTYTSVRGRLRRPGRRPNWIDGTVSPEKRKQFNLINFSLEDEVAPGHITVIRIDSDANQGRGYGLFLSYVLKEAYRLREKNLCDCPILHVIDEAQDIFNAGRTFQQAAGNMLYQNIRKGRKLEIGFVLGVQSAASVPEDIRNLINTQIIHRHNNHTQAREALQSATPAQLAMTDTFGPGECLAAFYGARAVIHAQMRRSPFNLTKEND